MKTFEEVAINDQIAIKLLDNRFEGMIVSLGRVAFDEEGGELKMSFDYEVLDDNGITYNQEELETELGDCILDTIQKGIAKNDLVYTGGIDDNRENDPRESDSQ